MTATGMYDLSIEESLYDFDEPVLFVAKVGHLPCVFLKVNDFEGVAEYLSCYIDADHLEGLRDGRLSIRGAFESQSENYIVWVSDGLSVLAEKLASSDEVEDRLPDRNVGILERFGECPDVLQAKDDLLTVYFRGGALGRKSIPYSVLMGLLGRVQGLARTSLLPPSLRGKRYKTLDFLVGDPALGSLMISIKRPTFELKALRGNQFGAELTREDIWAGISQQKDSFLVDLEHLLSAPYDARLQSEDDGETLYASVRDILPSSKTPFTDVTIASSQGQVQRRVTISTEGAELVRASYDRGNSATLSRSGKMIEINAASATFLLRSDFGQTTTCSLRRSSFDQVRADQRFRIGSTVKVTGKIIKRPRRDYMFVDSFEYLASGGM